MLSYMGCSLLHSLLILSLTPPSLNTAMSAASEVLHPVDALADQAGSVLKQGSDFFSSRPITTSDVNTTTTTTASATAYSFPLDSIHFANLQRYLLSGIKLPSNENEFKLEYPPDLLKQYTNKHSPELYDRTQTVFLGINSHCTDFKNDTMSLSVTVATSIADFGETAQTAAETAEAALTVMMTPGIQNNDSKYEDALSQFSVVIDNLVKSAGRAQDECQKVFEGLTKFETTVIGDEEKLKAVAKDTSIVLPKAADLNAEMQQRMTAEHDRVVKLVRDQNAAVKKGPSFRWWLAFIPFNGGSIFIDDSITRVGDYAGALRKAMDDYEKTISLLEAEVQRGLLLRNVTASLSETIKEVLAAIKPAADALGKMASAFANLKANLAKIDDSLGLAAGAAVNTFAFKRRNALKHLKQAAEVTWPLVANLARRYAEQGLPLTRPVDREALRKVQQVEVVEILGSNWGGTDVTSYSKALFFFGTDVKIRTVEPGFLDPWEGTYKSISVFHRCGDSLRIFVCRESSGEKNEHILRPGPIARSSVAGGELLEVKSFAPPPPAGAKIKIHAIVWGSQVIQDKRSYDYVYDCHAHGKPVNFNTADIGCGNDTWYGIQKSGTVYYVFNNSDEVHQLFGRENTEVGF